MEFAGRRVQNYVEPPLSRSTGLYEGESSLPFRNPFRSGRPLNPETTSTSRVFPSSPFHLVSPPSRPTRFMPPAGFIKIDSSNSTTTVWQRTTRRRMARTGGVVDRGQRPRVKNCTLACCTSAPLSIVAGLTTLSIVRLLCPTTESALPRGPEPGEEAVVARGSHAVSIPFEPCRSHAKRRTLFFR